MKVTMGLDTVELILWSEQEFELEIPDSDTVNLFTVGLFSTYIHDKLFDLHGSKASSEAEIFARIKKFLVAELKIAPEKISRSSTFIKGLGLDQ